MAEEKTYEEWLEGIKNYKSAHDTLDNVPEKFKTAELCLKAVKKDAVDCTPALLFYVPENLRTAEICKWAGKKNSSNFEYIPEELKTPELCLEGLTASKKKKYWHLLPDIPKKLWEDPDFCLKAVEINPYALEKIPESARTLEICTAAVVNSMASMVHNIFKETPEALKEQVKNAVQQKPDLSLIYKNIQRL